MASAASRVCSWRKLPSFLRRDVLLQSAVELCARSTFQGIPHLGLSSLVALPACGFVVGVNLYGEVLMSVDELDEQRKLVAEALIVLLPHQGALLFAY